MRKVCYFLFGLSLMLVASIVDANTIKSIDVTMELDKMGNAKVTEVWDMNITEGTEVFKPIGDLGNGDISNFRVSMNGKAFSYESYWDTNRSFSEKAYKNGISSSNELCFGMSKRGHNIYTLTYDLSKAIFNVSDAQVLYYKFINDSMNPAPKHISLKVKSYYSFPDTLDVWGYGYKGYAYVSDGLIQASNENDFDSSMYGVVLVKFPTGVFDTDNTISYFSSFDDVYKKAESGTFDYDYTDYGYSNTKSSFLAELFSTIISFLVPILIILGGIWGVKNSGYKKYRRYNIDMKSINNFRDIPCNKDIFMAFFLAEVYGLDNKKNDFLGALLLKWLKEDQIRIITKDKSGMFKKSEDTSFDLSKDIVSDNDLEVKMYNMLRRASGDNILEARELEKWCKSNYSEYFNWFDKVLASCKNFYMDSGFIGDEVIDGKNKKHICNMRMHEEAVKLAGLKKFLLEFSRIDEKGAIEVKMWDEYLIFAQIFGIADKVSKQFKKLYPELATQMDSNYNLNTFIFINSISTRSYSTASSARSAAESYSSGGGGFSSGGGGGGSFGGGSGGGCR